MKTLATGIDYGDLNFRDRSGVIATGLLHGSEGLAIVDPGPSSCLPVLRKVLEARGMGIKDIRSILLTHIHLDHAGATGTLVGENPAIEVFVHEKGARHMIDPSKLLASASILYGDRMDSLWGEVRAVPAANVHSLSGDERITAGGHTLDVAYTPGHASHHVSYFDADSGVAFVGDTAGIRRVGSMMVVPPTPPPDIDPDAWAQSVERITRWRPGTLFITHFGPFTDVENHLSELLNELRQNSALARSLIEKPGTEEERAAAFAEHLRRNLRARMSESEAERYEVAGGFQYNWQGLARYWRKRLVG